MSVNLNLNRTNFQAQLRSKPLRENEIDIENAVNDLQSQISAIATAATGTFAEITNARDYHSVLRDRLRSASKAQHNIVVSGGAITPQASPNMTVHAAAGEAIVNGIACKWVASDSGTITAPTTARYDVVVANSDNSLSVVAGANTSAPYYPDIADSQVPLAVLSLTAGSSVINTAMISDARTNFNYYFRNGADWEHIWNPGKRVRRQVFTSSGTWYKPTGVTQVVVTLVGGGGTGGAGGNGPASAGGQGAGGGGGGSGSVLKNIFSVSGNISVTIGNADTDSTFGSMTAKKGNTGTAGGDGVAGSGGGAGGAGGLGANGNSTCGYTLTQGAGTAGSSGAASNASIAGCGSGGGGGGGGGSGGTGGNGGTGGGGLGFAGGAGGNGGSGNGGGGGGGGGGFGGLGGTGGNGGATGSAGSAGVGYGAGGGGGGGASGVGASGGAGGAGAPGVCVVEWEE